MSLIDAEKDTEWQTFFEFYPDPTRTLLEGSGLDEEKILQQTPQLANIPIEDLKKRIGIFSATVEIKTLTPNITVEFLMLEQRRLSQLTTLAVEDDLTGATLVEICSSPIGINAEILLRHIACTIEQNPYDKFLLGKRDEQLLLSALQYSKEQEDITNKKRIEQILVKVKKSSEKKAHSITSFKPSPLSI